MKDGDFVGYAFVEFIPSELDDGRLYISITYATVVHRCFCGCGEEVVTPLTPTDWALTFDGETVSLYPSVGNWTLPCKSHYWVRRSRLEWAPTWTEEEIAEGRRQSRLAKERYYAEPGESLLHRAEGVKANRRGLIGRLWSRVKTWVS